jgi:hypothetical protein
MDFENNQQEDEENRDSEDGRGSNEDEDQPIEIHDIDLRESSSNRIIFRKIPFSLWIVGSIIFIASIYLLYHVALGSYGVLFNGMQEG